ncbi:MAG: UDP-N-acetylglucosamine 2-epimerase, partial [Phycisphaerae bacterium]|nr:UDP-N-acetylglucosamine 2-epimerase [Phycisphaerae bacterium]
AARRIVRMGEAADRVYVVGAPGLDRLFELRREAPRASARTGPVLVVQHPCGRSAEHERRVMTGILQSVAATGLDTVVLYPNSDRGHRGIVAAIRAERSRFGSGALRVAQSLPRDEYLRLLLSARVLVGNSSSGIVEAGAAGVPVVNIGRRQAGRLRAGSGVVDCAESVPAVRSALRRALRLRPRMLGVNPYGRGGAGRRIAAILGRVSLGPDLLAKQITY